MKKYFLHDGSQQAGPFDIEDLATKHLTKDTPIWYDGLNEWTTVGEIEELKELVKPTPPPFKPKTENTSSTKISSEELKSKTLVSNTDTTRASEGLRQSASFVSPTKKPKRRIRLWIGLSILIIAAIVIIPKIQKEDEKSRFRSDPKNFVSVVDNGYKYNKILGGIFDLKLTLINNSDFTLDNVRVVVSYIRKNGDTYKEEFVDASYILPHGQSTVSAPDSEAGMSVTYRVYSVTSSEAGAY